MAREYIKKYLVMKNEVKTIFDDLNKYRSFCVQYGFVFNEADLYRERTPYSDYLRLQHGRYPRDNWGWMMRQSKRNHHA